MRITIEIEGLEAASVVSQTKAAPAKPEGDMQPPPEVLAAAAGALNAGPAAIARQAPGEPQVPIPSAESSVPIAGVEDMAAGAAPSSLPGAPPAGTGARN